MTSWISLYDLHCFLPYFKEVMLMLINVKTADEIVYNFLNFLSFK